MDEETNEYDSIDAAVSAFMGEDEDKEDTSEDLEEEEEEEEDDDPGEDEDDDDDDDDDSDDTDDDDPGEDEAEDEEEPVVAEDDYVVTITVDGQETKMKVGDLRRLAGQEKALTQRSQNLAEQRRLVETQGMLMAKMLEDRYNAAHAEAQKYAKVDLWDAHNRLDEDDFKALKDAKEAAESNLQAIEQEGRAFIQTAQNTRSEMLRAQAQEALRTLQRDIPEWNDTLYADLRNYAVKMGMDTTIVNELVDPAAFKIIYRAMQADRTAEKAKTVKKRVAKTPARVVKKAKATSDNKTSKLRAARKKAIEGGGSVDDVTELFYASLAD